MNRRIAALIALAGALALAAPAASAHSRKERDRGKRGGWHRPRPEYRCRGPEWKRARHGCRSHRTQPYWSRRDYYRRCRGKGSEGAVLGELFEVVLRRIR